MQNRRGALTFRQPQNCPARNLFFSAHPPSSSSITPATSLVECNKLHQLNNITTWTDSHSYPNLSFRSSSPTCPNLETLTIEPCPEEILEYFVTPSVLKPQEMWKGNVEVYECITRTLRMVEVKGYMGSQHELDLLSYLLTHGRCVEQLTVITSTDEEVNGGNPEQFRLKAQEFLHQVEAASQNPNLEITVL